jgi:hypothetical protein
LEIFFYLFEVEKEVERIRAHNPTACKAAERGSPSKFIIRIQMEIGVLYKFEITMKIIREIFEKLCKI